jgi:hypothetical protein
MSATIYQFPEGGRAGLTGPVRDANSDSIEQASAPAVTACGVAWYHEEAIKEEERPRTR